MNNRDDKVMDPLADLLGPTSPPPLSCGGAPAGAGAVLPPPPPAYSVLPYRDVDFHLAPFLNNKLGEIELETSDGKRFLVHKRVLEAEAIFFHI